MSPVLAPFILGFSIAFAAIASVPHAKAGEIRLHIVPDGYGALAVRDAGGSTQYRIVPDGYGRLAIRDRSGRTVATIRDDDLRRGTLRVEPRRSAQERR